MKQQISTKFLPTEEAILPQSVNLAEEMKLEIWAKHFICKKIQAYLPLYPELAKQENACPEKVINCGRAHLLT